MISAIVVAGGKGTRLSSTEKKQFMKIAGKEILAYAIEAFNNVELVDEIVVVCGEDDIEFVRKGIDLPLLFPTEKGRLTARCMNPDRNRKHTACVASFLSVLKLSLLPHASVDKEVCFLSGRYICSCQQGSQEVAFDLTVIRPYIFGPPVGH